MHRSDWELAVSCRHQIGALAADWRSCAPLGRNHQGPARVLTQLRHRLGIGLIHLGHALTDTGAGRALPTPTAQATTTWRPSF